MCLLHPKSDSAGLFSCLNLCFDPHSAVFGVFSLYVLCRVSIKQQLPSTAQPRVPSLPSQTHKAPHTHTHPHIPPLFYYPMSSMQTQISTSRSRCPSTGINKQYTRIQEQEVVSTWECVRDVGGSVGS